MSISREVCGVQLLLKEEDEKFFGGDDAIIKKWWNPRSGDVCLDIGCGPGTWSLVALSKGAIVFAFDPKLEAVRMFAEHSLLNGFYRVAIIPCGVLHYCGTAHFNGNKFLAQAEDEEGRPPRLPVTSLNRWYRDFRPNQIDWINMDAEGAEELIVQGGDCVIADFQPNLIIEVHEGVDRKLLKQRLSDLSHDYEFENDGGFLLAKAG